MKIAAIQQSLAINTMLKGNNNPTAKLLSTISKITAPPPKVPTYNKHGNLINMLSKGINLNVRG